MQVSEKQDRMPADDLFHPDHMIPAAELISALPKFPSLCKSESGVKPSAVLVQIFILCFRISDAGVEIQDPHLFQPCFQGFIEHSPKS